MKMMMKRVFVLIAACLLLVTAGGCAAFQLFRAAGELKHVPSPTPYASPAPLPESKRADVHFSDMAYTRPDTKAIGEKLDALSAAITRGDPAEELLAAYTEITDLYNDADSQMSLAYLLYAFDVTEDTYETEYSTLQSELTRLDLSMTDVSIALFESSAEAESAAKSAFGEEYVETVYAEESLNDEKIQDLVDAENELVVEYDRLSTSFTVSDRGRQWTLDDILADDTLDYNGYLALYQTYCEAFNREAGEIFTELLGIRKQIAETLGYGSYAAYGYDLYGRDYTVLDAQRLHAAVKKYIVPVYLAAEDDTDQLIGLYRADFDEETFLANLRTVASAFSPDLSESLSYLLKNGLYDTAVSSKKMEGSFTTYLSNYNAPFLFTQWTGGSGDPSTFIHELGHFTNFYHNPAAGWSAGDSLDLAEVDSQALELLTIAYYDTIYGEYAEAAETDRLMDCMYAILSGCMEDEFQQAVYAHPSMTLDEMNALYRKLAGEYGFAELYGYTGTEWAMVPHTFQSPMYYISYAASMLPALELWERSQTDLAGAEETYFRILRRKPYAGFLETLEENDLSNVFSPDTVRRLASVIRDNL